MKSVVIIPARYGSTRLPGKLVRPEVKTRTGKYLLEHVYKNITHAKHINTVIVATDSQHIYDIVKRFGGKVVMTSPEHNSGTDRIAEVAANLDAEIVVNVQGDEPEVKAEMVDLVIETLEKTNDAVMSTLANRIEDINEITDQNVVKVVLDNSGYALYFSRAQIPWIRERDLQQGMLQVPYFRHLGIYAYRRDFLLNYTKLSPSYLEIAEKLEQLRALSNGFKIKVAITEATSFGIDTEDDLSKFMEKYNYD